MTHSAFDPNYKFPSIVRPAESVEATMRRVEAAADLVMERCPFCAASVELVAVRGGMPAAVGIEHEKGCPDGIAD